MLSLHFAEDVRKPFFVGKTFSYKDIIKAVPGAAWNGTQKRWEIPLDSVADARRIMPSINLSCEVMDAYRSLQERQQAAIAIKSLDESKAPCTVKGLKGKLYPYQAVGVQFLQTLDRGEGMILAYDMGLGKSLTSLASALEWRNKGIIDHILVVCPAPLKYSTWEAEVRKWTNFEYVVVDGDKSEEVEWEDGTKERMSGRALREIQYSQYGFGTAITIMNYELFLHDGEVTVWDKIRELTEEESQYYLRIGADYNIEKGRKEDSPKGLESASRILMQKLIPNDYRNYKVYGKKKLFLAKGRKLPNILPKVDSRWCVVLDEVHRIKTGSAQTTKNIFKYLKGAGYKIAGSGTPLENNVQEIHSIAEFCRPGMFGAYKKFVDRYCEVDFFGSVTCIKPQMAQELRDKLAPIMLRKTKAEALPDLPPLTIQENWVDMVPAQKKLYEQVRAGILQDMETEEFSYLEVLAQITRLQQVLDSPVLLQKVLNDPNLSPESGKLNALKELVEDVKPQTNKFIIFSQYREMTDILYQWLIDQKLLPKEQIGYIKGGMKSMETARIQQGFQEGNIQCIVMTTAGNYGLNLFKAKYVLCYDSLFNPQKMNQIYSRAHRNGVLEGVTAINLVTRNSYEEKKLQILEAKKELFKAMIDADDEAFAKLFTTQDLRNLI